MSRTPLGRGLDSLLGVVVAGQPAATDNGVGEIEISQVKPNPKQPRQLFNEDSLAILAVSIKQQGVMQPLLVRRIDDGTLQLISGERRWRAAQVAGLEKVPIIVREATESETVVLALVENLQREDLNPYDSAVAMQRLYQEYGLPQEEIAVAIGKSRASVSNAIRLLNLPKAVLSLLQHGRLEEAAARTLLALPAQSQLSVAQKVVKNGLSVRQTEELVRRHTKSKTAKRVNPDIVQLEDELADALGAGVSITQRGKRGGGYLRIQYRNLEQLQVIIDRIKK